MLVRIGAVVAAVIAVVAIGFLLIPERWKIQARYSVTCPGTDRLVMDYARKTPAELDRYISRLTFEDGIYVDRKGHHNGWIISYIALMQLDAYCQTGDADRLRAAIHTREWLPSHVLPTNDELGLLRFKYDFPNPPYSSKPGWGSAMSQSSATALMYLIRPRFSREDTTMLHHVTEASLHPVSEGGIYSPFENGTVFWEEVATEEKPSLIINGAQVATFYYDLVADLLPEGSQKDRLTDLNKRAIQALMDVQERMMLPDGRILYDLSSTPINTRKNDHYAHRIAVSWLKWVGGDEAETHLAALTGAPVGSP